MLQCLHLIPALNAWTTLAWYTATWLIATHFSGNGCMYALKTERRFNLNSFDEILIIVAWLNRVKEDMLQCLHLIPALNAWTTLAWYTATWLIATHFSGNGCMYALKTERRFNLNWCDEILIIVAWLNRAREGMLQCWHLIPALNARATPAWYTSARPIVTQLSGYGCMDDLKTECSFGLQANCRSLMCLNFFIDVLSMGVRSGTGRCPVDLCRN